MRKIISTTAMLLMFSWMLCGGSASAAASAPGAPFNYAWAKTWGGAGSDYAHRVVVAADGSVYVAGEFSGTVDFDPGSGVSSMTSNGGVDVFLSKFTANGSFQWAKTWGGPSRDVPNGLAVDLLGHVIVSGPFQNTVDFDPGPGSAVQSSNAGSMNNVFISQFDASGALLWVKTWGPADGGMESYSIALDASNHIYVQGDFTGTTVDLDPGPGSDIHTNHPGSIATFDAFLSKLDVNGNFVWARTWGGEGYDDGTGVTVDSHGNVYVGGMYASQSINFDPAGGPAGLNHPAHNSGFVVDVFLSKFNSAGDFQWVRTWGGAGGDDAGTVVIVDNLDNVYIGGRFTSTNCDFNPGGTPDLHSYHPGPKDIYGKDPSDAFISKYDPNGSFEWARTWGGSGNDSVGALAIDPANSVYITGFFADTVDFLVNGTAQITAQGGQDALFSLISAEGTPQWVKTWGGSMDDWGFQVGLTQDGTSGYVVGAISGQVDMDPGPGADLHTSAGLKDIFLSRFLSFSLPNTLYLPAIIR